ncbi:MAG: hypothetical protein Greene041614_1232, partial [Parcubacteria group bacterium Greene0416_14]
MRGKRMHMSLFTALVLVCCAVPVFGQENLMQMPDAVRLAIAGQKDELPDAVKSAVAGVRGDISATEASTTVRKSRSRIVCADAQPIQGIQSLSIPDIGDVHVYSTRIAWGDTVLGYWKKYSAFTEREIETRDAYLEAVKYLDSQISNLNEICRGSIIRLPATMAMIAEKTSPQVPVTKDVLDQEIVALGERVSRLDGIVDAQADMI